MNKLKNYLVSLAIKKARENQRINNYPIERIDFTREENGFRIYAYCVNQYGSIHTKFLEHLTYKEITSGETVVESDDIPYILEITSGETVVESDDIPYIFK